MSKYLNLQELYLKLEVYSNFDQGNNCEKFLDTVDKFVLRKDPESIPILLKYFDDDSEYSWIFEIIQNNILYLLNENGWKFLINFTPSFLNRSPEWCLDTFSIILNTKEFYKIFKDNIYYLSKKEAYRLLDNILRTSPHHRELITELLSELEKSDN